MVTRDEALEASLRVVEYLVGEYATKNTRPAAYIDDKIRLMSHNKFHAGQEVYVTGGTALGVPEQVWCEKCGLYIAITEDDTWELVEPAMRENDVWRLVSSRSNLRDVRSLVGKEFALCPHRIAGRWELASTYFDKDWDTIEFVRRG